MKNVILALVCVLVCAVTVEAACTSCGQGQRGRGRVIRRAPVRKVVKQAYPIRLRGTCVNGRCSN